MEEVDKFSSSRIAEPPCISVRIHAVTDAHDFIKDLEYSLDINGIQRVFDKELLQGSSQPQIDISISLDDDYIHSACECVTQNYLLVILIEVTLTFENCIYTTIMAHYSYTVTCLYLFLYFSYLKYLS